MTDFDAVVAELLAVGLFVWALCVLVTFLWCVRNVYRWGKSRRRKKRFTDEMKREHAEGIYYSVESVLQEIWEK